MAVTNLYSNLPGHLVEFKDGGLQLTSSSTDTSSTKSILILGTATDGPINEPVKIDATTVSQVFGKEVNADGYPNGATLTKYAKQAFKNGFDDVRCMRVTGSQAYTTLYGEETTDYEEASTIVDGAGNADGNGVIRGNEEFSWDFVAKDNTFVAANYTVNDHLMIDYNGDGNFTELGLQVNGKTSWDTYRGFTINADVFPMIGSLKFEGEGFQFIGDQTGDIDSTPGIDSNVSYEKADITIVDNGDGSTLKADYEITTPIDTNNIFEGTTGVGGTPIVASRYVVNNTTTGLPLVKDTDYTVVEDFENNKATFTFNSGVSIGDNVTVKYYPIKTIQVSRTFTQEDIKYTDSKIDVSAVADLKDAEITTITTTSGFSFIVAQHTPEEFARKFNVSGNMVTIKDTTGMVVGDTIKVVYKYKKPITSELEIKVKSQFGGSLYKDATVAVEKVTDEDGNTFTNVIFTKPSAKVTNQATKSYYYSSKYYVTIDDLILAMTNDGNNTNMFELEIVKGEGTDRVDLLEATAAKPLDQGGLDGLKPTNNEMFKALSGDRYTMADVGSLISEHSTAVVTEDMIGYLKTQGAYQILENYNVDYIYPAGIYADSVQTVNPKSDFQRELALVCAVLTYRTKMTHGFIDVKPNSNTTLVGVDSYVAKLINSHPNVYYMVDGDGNIVYDSDNKPMDIGWYTSVVAGPEVVMTSDTLGTYYGSPAIAYAALNAVLEPQSAPTNKALRNVNGIKFKFSNKQMDALIGNRMVCFKLKNEGSSTASSTPYVVDGVTAGARNCDYSRIVTVKVLTDVVDQIRQVADPFIGEQNTTEQRNALSALISKRLSKLVEAGEILSYEFEVSSTIQQQLLGEASIALTIVPAMELRKITTVVALRAAE